jgi:hypothetical protein
MNPEATTNRLSILLDILNALEGITLLPADFRGDLAILAGSCLRGILNAQLS